MKVWMMALVFAVGFGCAWVVRGMQEGRYQVTLLPHDTILRLDTTTGQTVLLGAGEWIPVSEERVPRKAK